MIWPTAYPMETSLISDQREFSQLRLPVLPREPVSVVQLPPPAEDPELPGYGSLASETVSGFAEIRDVIRNERTQTTTVVATNSGSDQYPWGIVNYNEKISHTLSDLHPADARVESTYTTTVLLNERTLILTGILIFRSDEKNYYYDYTRRLEEGGKVLREKNWTKVIPRE